MKKNIIIFIIGVFLMIFNGCFNSNSDDKPAIVNKKIPIMIKVLNANGSLVNENINLKFLGYDVYNSNNVKLNNITLEQNATKELKVYLRDNPNTVKDLRILVNADNYSQTGTIIQLNKNILSYDKNIKLIEDKPGKLASGIFASFLPIENVTDENGTTLSDINLKAQEDENKTSVSINIPSGTTFTDENGNIVNATMLKMVSFDANDSESLNAYPGGLNVIANVDGFEGNTTSNSTSQINFKSAAFAMITIEDNNGTKVRHFDKNITITMQFPVGTKDANGNVVVVGDEVPIWSYDESTSLWSYDKVAIVSNDDNDNLLEASYQTDHLTYWNLDWHYGEVCTSTINVLDNNGDAIQVPLNLVINIPDTSVINRPTQYTSNDGEMHYYNTPSGYPGSITAYYLGNEVGTITTDDFCANDTNLSVDINVTVLDTNLSFEYQCENGENIPGTSQTSLPVDVRYYSNYLYGITNNANVNLNLVSGTSLSLTIYGLYNDIYWNHINWNNTQNSNSINVTSGTNLNTVFYLDEKYCSPYDNNITTIAKNYKPVDVVETSNGDIYFSSYDGVLSSSINNKIFKIDSTTNTISTYIGTGVAGYNGNGINEISISNQMLSNPSGLAILDNTLYIADKGNHCIREVDLTTNMIKDVVGTCGTSGDSSNDDNSTDSVLNMPTDVEIYKDTYGYNIFISDSGNRKLKLVSNLFDNKIITLAGGGNSTNDNNDSNKRNNALESNISVDWIALSGISSSSYSDGNESDINGSIPVEEYSKSKYINGTVYISSSNENKVRAISIDLSSYGNSTNLNIYNYIYIILGENANIGYGQSNSSGDGSNAISANINYPKDLEIDSYKNIYISDMLGNKIRKIDTANGQLYNRTSWIITTIAGDGTINTVNNVSSSLSGVEKPIGLFINSNDDFYISEHGSKIRKVSY